MIYLDKGFHGVPAFVEVDQCLRLLLHLQPGDVLPTNRQIVVDGGIIQYTGLAALHCDKGSQYIFTENFLFPDPRP